MELSPWLSVPRITVGLHARIEQPLLEEETIVAPAFFDSAAPPATTFVGWDCIALHRRSKREWFLTVV